MEFAIASGIIGAIAAIPYIATMWSGHRPPYSTYLGWLLIGTTGFAFHLQTIAPGDAKWSALLPALYILIPFVYLSLLFFLKAGWDLTKRDKVCLSGVAVCWCVWVATHISGATSIALPLVALVATDAFSSWPILQDAYRGKESARKNQVSWALTEISVVAGVASVAQPWSLEMVYPGYLLLMMGAICFCSLFSFRWRVHKPAPWAPTRSQPFRPAQ